MRIAAAPHAGAYGVRHRSYSVHPRETRGIGVEPFAIQMHRTRAHRLQLHLRLPFVDVGVALGADIRQEAIRPDSLQQDPEAASFRAGIAEKRAVCLGGLGRLAGAEREARRALSLTANVRDARYVLALIALDRGRTPEALAQLDTPISHHPEDDEARALRERATA